MHTFNVPVLAQEPAFIMHVVGASRIADINDWFILTLSRHEQDGTAGCAARLMFHSFRVATVV